MLGKIRTFILIGIFSGLTLLTGCATTDYGTPMSNNDIAIETQGSRIASISQVKMYKQKDGYLIRGKVIRSTHGRSHIRGHIDIELLNSKGEIVFKDTTGYRHSNIRFRSEYFSLKMSQKLDKGIRLRILHRESSHRNENVNSK